VAPFLFAIFSSGQEQGGQKLLINNLGTEVEADASPILDIVSAGLAPADAQGIQTLLRGKSASRLADSIAGDPKDADPIQEGRQAASEWHGSVKSLIGACVRIRRVLLTWRDDKAHIEAFLRALVAGHVLSRAETRLGLAAPKLCKLVKIGQGADLLQRSQIAPFLMPSYTTLYQLIVLSETLPDSEEEHKTAALTRILANCPGEISREYLIEETRRLKRTRGTAEAVSELRLPERAETDKKPRDLLEAGEQFELMLLTPSKSDLRLLRADYSDGTLERCLPLFKLIRESAGAVIATQIADLSLIENVLLPSCGFSRLSHVLLVRRPTSLDVTDAEVVITAERGEMQLSPSEAWLNDAERIDAPTMAARLYPLTSRRLHVFAAAHTDGWHCLVGNDSWVEEPSIR
jgi:hypothetical protein